MFDLEQNVADLVLAVPPNDTPDPFKSAALQYPELAADDAEVISEGDGTDKTAVDTPLKVYWDEAAFYRQFINAHATVGGMVTMRTGAPCPLAEHAKTDGGREASNATYQMIASNPFLKELILEQKSTFYGLMALIGWHGYGCMQIVKMSLAEAQPLPDQEPPEFGGEE